MVDNLAIFFPQTLYPLFSCFFSYFQADQLSRGWRLIPSPLPTEIFIFLLISFLLQKNILCWDRVGIDFPCFNAGRHKSSQVLMSHQDKVFTTPSTLCCDGGIVRCVPCGTISGTIKIYRVSVTDGLPVETRRALRRLQTWLVLSCSFHLKGLYEMSATKQVTRTHRPEEWGRLKRDKNQERTQMREWLMGREDGEGWMNRLRPRLSNFLLIHSPLQH